MEAIQFTAILNKVQTSQDGGGKVTLEFGADAIEAVIKLQRLNAKGDTILMVACVPFTETSELNES